MVVLLRPILIFSSSNGGTNVYVVVNHPPLFVLALLPCLGHLENLTLKFNRLNVF